jgi:hypothetical protein
MPSNYCKVAEIWLRRTSTGASRFDTRPIPGNEPARELSGRLRPILLRCIRLEWNAGHAARARSDLQSADETTLQAALAAAWGNITNIAADAVKVAADVVSATGAAVDDVEATDAAADITNLPDAVDTPDASSLPEAVKVVDPAEVANAEPRDDLQSAIDRLQKYWGPGPGRGSVT